MDQLTDEQECIQELGSVEQTVAGDLGRDPLEHQLESGYNLDRYVILEKIGAGGMGVVYKAYDPKLDRAIALKLLPTYTELNAAADQRNQRLLVEAIALAQLAHPNVVAIYDVGRVPEGVFLAMEYVEGKTLRNWLEDSQPDWLSILSVFISAGKGLLAAHEAGIIHRDFKPDNVIIGQDQRVRVLDFGLARADTEVESVSDIRLEVEQSGSLDFSEQLLGSVESSGSSQLLSSRGTTSNRRLLFTQTCAGGFAGTPAYMAPEQFRGQALGPHTDQYNFAVSVYQSLYGRLPFAGKTIAEYRKQVLHGRIRKPPSDSGAPLWIRDVLSKSLSRNPASRYRSMKELLAALDYDPVEVQRKRSLRRRIVVSLIMSALLFAGLLMGWQFWFPTVVICGGARDRVQTIYDTQTRNQLATHFASFADPRATDTWRRIETVLNRYLQNWQSMYTDACLATQVRKEQSQTLLDARMWCLNQRLEQVGALLTVFAQSDRKVVASAVMAVHNLTPLRGCADTNSLMNKIAPREEIKEQVDQISSQLAQIKALHDTGKYDVGYALVKKCLQRADDLGYQPLQAWSYYWLGRLVERLGKRAESAEAYRTTLRMAERAYDDELRARTMSMLIYVNGLFLNRPRQAHLWARKAHAVLDRMGGNDLIRAFVQGNEGFVLYAEGKYKQSQTLLQQSYQGLIQELGDSNPKIAVVLNALGNVSRALGDNKKALEYLAQGRKIATQTVGQDHAFTADVISNLGLTNLKLKNYSKSLELQNLALDIYRRLLGPEHPSTGMAYHYLAMTFVAMGKLDKAIECYKRSIQICEKHQCETFFVADNHLALAKCYLSKDRKRALYHANQARLCLKQLATRPDRLEDLESWMKQHKLLK